MTRKLNILGAFCLVFIIGGRQVMSDRNFMISIVFILFILMIIIYSKYRASKENGTLKIKSYYPLIFGVIVSIGISIYYFLHI